ncbi:hypothetical protein NIM87_13160 [Devosia sp. XJ19-1]|uniref:Uncharacterized protein n=1 Tax=Devosia ureilytica TaxID=2952754 RepID=A0A9Q4FTS9_9HYPH|nr:hypothetical protein [Devosia ureilytica]MCP8884462.1 hypothetical protein [Devosia ureilytica]MCP8888070.1 hypothetical protein [Devosia ureilytica]
MPRTRLAIAHFADVDAAMAVRQALIAHGASAIQLITGHEADQRGACRLEVTLTNTIDRQLLGVLLSSTASRVDIHDIN